MGEVHNGTSTSYHQSTSHSYHHYLLHPSAHNHNHPLSHPAPYSRTETTALDIVPSPGAYNNYYHLTPPPIPSSSSSHYYPSQREYVEASPRTVYAALEYYDVDGRGGCGGMGAEMYRMGGGGGGGGGGGMLMGTKFRKGKDDKICGVCGDRALSYNFDAISCESCKAFFRRNAPKGLDYFKCPYDERCRMDVSNRRFCKRCRLNKCFEIGMRKEYILSDEEKAQKRQKIEANRMMRHMERPSLSMMCVNEVTSQTIALRIDDAMAIEELTIAYKTSIETPSGAEHQEFSRDKANMVDLINIAELSMRRVIAMTKRIGTFRVLPQEDQIQLLKTGSIELLILRSVITFDKDKQHFLDPCDQEETKAMNIEQLQKAENGTGLFEDHMKFVRSLAIDLRADETTLILLLIISLFSPDRENITSKEYVSGEQERYCQLLRRYLESRYSCAMARILFPRFIMKLTDIRSLNEDHSHVLLKLNTDGIQPLMKEVLDLSR